MSIDYYVYLKKPEAFSVEAFESYCESLGLRVKMHPQFHFREDTGFSPLCLTDERLAKNGENHRFLSGFEFSASPYRHVIQTRNQAVGLLGRLFRPKAPQESPFDAAVKDASVLVELRCGTGDAFEVLLGYAFGAYLVKSYGGVFDDPQSGKFYTACGPMEHQVAEILAELLNQAEAGELRTHPFTGWA